MREILGVNVKEIGEFDEVAEHLADRERINQRLAASNATLRDLNAKHAQLAAKCADSGYYDAVALAVLDEDTDLAADLAALNTAINEQQLRNRSASRAIEIADERLRVAKARAGIAACESLKSAVKKKVAELTKALAAANKISAELHDARGALALAGFGVEHFLDASYFRPVTTHGDLWRWLQLQVANGLLTKAQVASLGLESRMPQGADPSL